MKHPASARPTLPLGIDIGATRVRVALARPARSGNVELIAVAARERGDDLSSTIAEAIEELQTRERRCVFCVGEPAAQLRVAAFPPMRPLERERAARYEASRFIDYPIEQAQVRTVALDAAAQRIAIGVVRKSVLDALKATARAAKLRLVAIDNSALALRRALDDVDAILDVGFTASVLHVYSGSVPLTFRLPVGGSAFTQAIADALGTDLATAERRKNAYGLAGSADGAVDAFVAGVAQALAECRARGDGDVRSLMLVGNGARLTGLAPLVERATAVRVAIATLAPDVSPTLPPDVLRAAAPDWCQAYGLALWAAA